MKRKRRIRGATKNFSIKTRVESLSASGTRLLRDVESLSLPVCTLLKVRDVTISSNIN
ncbi:MAG: hypothetical protein IGS39_00890 [Calothrix sp. C42_A2020_038]|nr:hypothetical protein [Calothrix sp. C42_A2020_038]